MITKIEALLDALANLNGMHIPSSRAYKNRNPLLLKAFSEKHMRDEDGYRVFNSIASGYNNGINDLQIKCSGKSYSKLQPSDTLKDLVKHFGNDASATRSVKNFLRHALDNMDIYENTPLSFFMDEAPKELGE
jgi:hypothetical protein